MDFPGRLIAGLLALILILIFPLQYIAHSHSENTDALIDDKTHRLTDDIRSKGYLDVHMYEDYINFLDTTGEIYSFDIQDIKPVKGEEILNNNTFKTSIVPVSYKYIKSFSSHSHTDDCYAGHRHNTECRGMPLTFTISSSFYSDGSQSESINVNCGYCQKEILHIGNGYSSYNSTRYINIRTGNIFQSYNDYSDRKKYSELISEYTNLRSNLQPYIYRSESNSSGNYGSYSGYGYVKYENYTFELPLLGKISKCEIPGSPACDGIPKVFTVRGGYDFYYSYWKYEFICHYCRCKIIEASYNYINGKASYNLSIYKKGNSWPVATYNDYNLLSPFFDVLSQYKYDNNNIDTKITADDPVLQYSFLKEAVNHGCIYPEPACNLSEDNNPICDQVVISITATNPVQTVFVGEKIITTAIATYLDGHTGIVNCTDNFNPNYIGTQTVTLTYNGIVGNAKTTGTRTCTVTVTVKSKKMLSSLTVLPTSQTIQKYKNPSFTVKSIYSDGTSRILSPDEYTVTGFVASEIGTQNITISYSENDITKSASVSVTVTPLQRECPICHNTYELNSDDTDPGCPFCKVLVTGIEVTPDYVEVTQGDDLPVIVTAVYKDGSREIVTDWISNYNPEKVGIQIVTVEYSGYAKEVTVWVYPKLIRCPVCDTEYPATEDNCPVCAVKVISISVEPQELTVMQYDLISLNVTAYFVNGESRIVDDWSIDVNTNRAGTYIATVSYKEVSATIKLNVLSVFSTECPICGLRFNFSDSPKGCPVCSEELVGIEAYLTSGSNIVQLGSIPSIAVILIFRDNHREFTYESYTLEDFNPNVLGLQTVTVKYKEFSTTIIIEVVNALDTITCSNGHVYYNNADGTDPGCPYCQTAEDLSTVVYFAITYTSEILEEIYANGKYYFDKGNYITVILTKKDKSLFYKIQNTFFKTSLIGRKKKFVYGGNIT